jgi:cell division protein FtsN
LRGAIVAICCFIFAIAIAAFFFRYDSDHHSSKEVITEKVPVATGQATEIPDRSALSSPVNPEPPVLKEDIPIEPIQADESVVPADTSDRSKLEQRSTPMMTHSVQVGAFRRIENAEDLMDRLAVKGYSAQIVEVPDRQGRRWFTVRIGDHPTLESAEEHARIFTENENMRTFIRPYKAY